MPIFGPKICIFLRYAHITPIFWGQMDPNQWDHKSPISWGNSGYLRYSGMWPFGRSAGRFLAPIAQNSPFWVKKWCFLARNQFLWTSSIFFGTIMTGHQKDNFFVLTALHGGPRAGRWGWITAFLTLRKATLGNRGQKTARRAAERPPTGKPKVSRVTSGCGEVMIPLSRVCPSPKKGGYMGVA